MARKQAVFSGTMKYSLLTIPVKLYKPHFDEEVVPGSHLEHSCGKKVLELDGVPTETSGHACGKPVNQKWFCSACDSIVEYGTLVKVFDGGQSLTQSEVKSAKIPEKEFTIQEFVKAEDVDPMFLQGDMYFIEVDGKEALEAYSVLVYALKQSDRVGVAYYAARGTDKMMVVRPSRDGLIAQVLKCGNLVDTPSYGTTFSANVVDMAQMLQGMIERQTVALEPSKYKSTYVQNVRALLNPCDAPVVPVACEPKKSALADLLAAMKAAA